MKKLKRALSLLLTVVMLLGMFVVPTSAANTFADAEMIENTEAVQITSGIGLFAGTADGNFAPKAVVTRAQMATIIVKMLRGSDFNADAFKGVGVNPFPDTATFEGGWAEGYINACYQLGVVAGYGDGTFQPGKSVTTAEALTMVINALGVDPGPGEWPLTYMAKAEEMKLYGDLAVKPATNTALTRDQLAVIVWEGLQYSPEGKSGYKIPGSDLIFTDIADAVLANGNNFEGITEAVGQDSLASKVYEIKTATGWITDNAATGEPCTVLTSASGVETNYAMETGVDMLGHYVTIYYNEQYKNDEEPGQVYTIVDESTVVTVKEVIDTAKEYKAAFGKSINEAQNGFAFDDSYVADALLNNDMNIPGYTAGTNAPKGTYIIADGVIVTYIEPTAAYASYVTDINNTVGKESVWINGANGDAAIPNTEGDDRIVEYAGMTAGDFVTYVVVRDQYVLSPVTKVSGEVTKTSTKEINGEMLSTITLNERDYYAFSGNNYADELDTQLSKISFGQKYDLYVTGNGYYIGFEAADAAVSLENTLYLLGAITVKEKDQYGVNTFYNKARGVDMEGNEVMPVLGRSKDVNGNGYFDYGEDPEAVGSMGAILEGFYSVKDSTDKDEKKAGIQIVTAYPDMYSPETPTYTTTTNSKAADYTFSGSSTSALPTLEGVDSYGQSSMKFIVLGDNTLTQSGPLEVEIYTGSINPAIHSQKEYPLLVTRSETGVTSRMEALVVKNASGFGEQVYVYLTQEQLDSPAYTVDGKSYMAYTPGTGEEEEYILSEGCDLTGGPGFYLGTKEDDDLYTMVKAPHNAGNIANGPGDSVRQNQGFLGVNGDRLYAENLNSATTAGFAIRSTVMNTGANKAIVIDTRSEEEMEASGVAEITSMNQLMNMRKNNPETAVVLDVFARKSGTYSAILSVFVTRAERKTAGLGAMVYATKSPVSGDKMLAISSMAEDIGKPINVNFDVVQGSGAGFYYFGVNADGELTLVQRDPSYVVSGSYGVIGMHNLITQIDEMNKKLTTVNDTTNHECKNDCGHANEALKDIYITEQTKLYNADGVEMSFDELVELSKAESVVVDYYCASSGPSANQAIDETAEVLVVYKEPLPDKVDGCASCGKGFEINATTEKLMDGKTYVLCEDVTAVSKITVNGEVKLCLNGHTWTAPASGGNFITAASGAKLTICGGASNSGKIVGNSSATSAARGLELSGGATAEMTGVTVSGFKNTWGGGGVFVNEGSSLTVNNCTISGNEASQGGGMESRGTVIINDSTITGNKADQMGGGLSCWMGTATLKNVTIEGNTSVSNNANRGGGGLYVWAGACTAEDSTIKSNTAGTGADVYVRMDQNGIFNRTGGEVGVCYPADIGGSDDEQPTAHSCSACGMTSGTEITDSATSLTAGNYYLSDDVAANSNITVSGEVKLCLNGHTWTAPAGGATFITAASGAKLTICGGTSNSGKIVGNPSVTSSQGMKLSGSATVEMTGVTVSGFKNGGSGGGVLLNDGSNGSLTLNNCTISGNEASQGGGIEIRGGSVIMNGGTITGNTADQMGGGLSCWVGTATLKNATITNNTSVSNNANRGGGGVYVWAGSCTAEGSTIKSNTAGTGADVYVRMDKNGIFNRTGGEVGVCYPADIGGSDDEQPTEHSCSACGMTGGTEITGSEASLTAGSYYLSGDVTASSKITVNGEVKLCLNGHTWTAPASGSNFITAASGAKLTICGGTGSNGKILGNSSATSAARGVNLSSSATVEMTGVTVSGFKNTWGGGGVAVSAGSSLTMNNCTISGNQASQGGGIESNGTVIINDSTIAGNTADQMGGGLSCWQGTATLKNVTIEGNTSISNDANRGGGGVYVWAGACTAEDSTIKSNTAGTGADVYVRMDKNGIFNRTGGEVGVIYPNS